MGDNSAIELPFSVELPAATELSALPGTRPEGARRAEKFLEPEKEECVRKAVWRKLPVALGKGRSVNLPMTSSR